MEKRQQQFSIGYFIVALGAIFALQFFLVHPSVETLGYSRFKTLMKKGMVTNLVISEKDIRGEIVAGGLKEAVSAERFPALDKDAQQGKRAVSFVVVRVEDAELVNELEAAGIPFKGEITSDWLPTILSWVVPVALFFILGLVSLEGPRTPLFLPVPVQSAKEYSDDTARVIDAEVKQILTEAHEKVKQTLATHRQALEDLAQLLLKKEVVERPELQAILKVVSIDRAKDRKKAIGTADSEELETSR